jgi:hypothetical protein
MRYILLLCCCITNYACKSSYKPSKLYIMKYKNGYEISKDDYITKMSFAPLTKDTLIWLDFDMIHGMDKKNRIFFKLDDNKKKYYLNDTIEINNSAHKIVGLVYNDTLVNLAIIGYPEKNFNDIEKMDTLSEEYILYKKESGINFNYWTEYLNEYHRYVKEFYTEQFYYNNFEPYPCHIYPPLFTVCTSYFIETHLSVILVEICKK